MNTLYQHNWRQDRAGSALVVVMGVVLLIAMVAAGMIAVGRQQIFSTERQRDYVKAQLIAESGANQAYSLLKTNFAARNNAALFPLTSFDEGSYDVTVISISSNKASIISTGFCGNVSAVARMDCKNYPLPLTNAPPPPVPGLNAYGFAMLAGGNLGWAGNSDMQISNGWMHCNGIYSANGVNTVRGNVEACGGISMVGGATITGTGKAPSISGGTIGTRVVAAVPLVAIPDIDLTPYYSTALTNGQVFSGSKSLSGTVTPAGGIMWVNGSLSFGNGTYNGCFIATGDIELKTTGNGTITQTAAQRYPVLVSRDGTITVKQAKTWTFTGLVYCKTGSFDKQGNGDVFGNGAIIAAGNISKNGGWSGMLYSDPTPIPPGGLSPTIVDRVVITAWQD